MAYGYLVLILVATLDVVMLCYFYGRALGRKWPLPPGLSESWLGSHTLRKLEYGGNRRRLTWLFPVGLQGFFVGQIVWDWSEFREIPMDIALVFMLLFLPVVTLPWYYPIEAYGVAHLVTDAGLVKRSPFSKTVMIRWNEVERISFHWLLGDFSIRSRDGRMRISPVIQGLDSFAKGVIENVPKKKYVSAIKYVNRALGGPFQP